jgi:hypothetical protein
METLVVLAFSACIFFLRFIQWCLFLGRRLGQKHFAYIDTWWFLIEARKLRKGNFKLFSKYREERPEWENDYPPLFQYLLAIVPDKHMKEIIRNAVPFLDAFTAATLFSLVSLITNSWEYGVLGVIVYFSSPMIFQQNFCLCVRPLTIFIVSIIYLLSRSFSIPSFLGISILIAMILLLHKFATQVVIFTSLAFLAIGRVDYLLSFFAGFLIATLVSRGYYLKVLRAHVNRLRSSDLKHFANSRAENPLKRTAVLAVYCPWLLFFIISVFFVNWNTFLPLLVCDIVWILTLTILSVATNFSILRVIGEGWRYLGYLVFPMAFYAVSIIDQSFIIQLIYLSVAFSGFAISYYYSQRLFKGHQKYLVSTVDMEIFKKISSIEGKTMTAYPGEFTYIIAYFGEKDYAATPENANIIVVNKELAEKSLIQTLEEKGYAQKLEEKGWIVLIR